MGNSRRVLLLAGLGVFLAAFDGSALFLALPAIASEFGARVSDLTNLGSVLGLGSLAALPLASLADRTGRRRVLAGAVTGFCLANLATCLVGGLAALAVARFFASCFEVLAITVASVLVVEEVPSDHRALAVAGLTVASGAGGGLTTLLYPLLAPHWRLLYLLGAVGVAAGPLTWRFLPETATWQRSEARRGSPLRVLRERAWRGRLLLLSAFGFLGAIAYTPGGLLGALFASRDLHLSPLSISTVLVATGLVAAVGYVAGGWLSDRAGRRAPAIGLSLLSALASILTYLGTVHSFWVGNVAYEVVASAAGPIVVVWFAELFPTRARATSQAVATVVGALGGIAGLQVVGALAGRVGLGPSLVAIGLFPLLAVILLLFLPETRGQPLPD